MDFLPLHAFVAPGGCVRAQIVWLHERDRWDQSFEPVSNEFPGDFMKATDLESEESKYFQGVLMYAAILLALGLVISLVVVLAYLCAVCPLPCCCTGSIRRHWADRPKSIHTCRIVVWLFGLFFLVTVPIAFVGSAALMSGVGDSVDAVDDLADLLDSANSTAGELVVAAHNVSTQAEAFVQELQACCLIDPSCCDVADSADTISKSAKAAESEAARGAQSVSDLVDSLDGFSSASDSLGGNTATGGWAWSVVLAVCVIVSVLTTLKMNLCRPLNKACNVVMLLLLIVTWVATAVFLGVSILAADFCVAPDSTATNLMETAFPPVNNSLDDPMTVVFDSTRFYLQECAKDEAGLPYDPLGVYAKMVEGVERIASAQDELVVMREAAAGITLAPVRESANERAEAIESALDVAYDAATRARDDFACAAVRPIWVDLIGGLCNTAVGNGVVFLWGATVAAAVCLSIVLLVGLPFCSVHPVDVAPEASMHNYAPAHSNQVTAVGGSHAGRVQVAYKS